MCTPYTTAAQLWSLQCPSYWNWLQRWQEGAGNGFELTMDPIVLNLIGIVGWPEFNPKYWDWVAYRWKAWKLRTQNERELHFFCTQVMTVKCRPFTAASNHTPRGPWPRLQRLAPLLGWKKEKSPSLCWLPCSSKDKPQICLSELYWKNSKDNNNYYQNWELYAKHSTILLYLNQWK